METDWMPELEPCPFCGQQAVISTNPGHNWNGAESNVNVGACYGLWSVGCPAASHEGSVGHCEVHPTASWYAKLRDAIAAWNTRTTDKGKQDE